MALYQTRYGHWAFVMTRLWRYFSLYFLKPFDAVNDTLTASLLARLNWDGKFAEIGSGDGVYSYILHGGAFPLSFDRYLITDLSQGDIYDTHRPEVVAALRTIRYPEIALAVDARISHVAKIREIGFAQSAICSNYEKLPVASSSADGIFFYTPHGLVDHGLAIQEAGRLLRPGGKFLILVYDQDFKAAFLCHRLARSLPEPWAGYFQRLDNGRYEEITRMSRSPREWIGFFESRGYSLRSSEAGLGRICWTVYDVQTRPFLKPMIRLFNAMPRGPRTFAKFVWMILWYPWLLLFYMLFANDLVPFGTRNCYLAYEFVKSEVPR